MNTQIEQSDIEQLRWPQRLSLFIIFLICGTAIFVFGSNYFTIFPTNRNLTYSALLSASLLIAALWFKRDARLKSYWQITYAYFAASFAFLFTLYFNGWSSKVLNWFHLSIASSQGIAIAKLTEMAMVVLPIIVLVKLSGADLGSIYLQRGNVKWSLSIGALVLANFGTSALLFFAERYSGLDKLGAAIIWGLVFSFANGFMEELWLRGIFLQHLKPLLGAFSSIMLTSLIFALMHVGSVYLTPAAIPIMLAYALTLGLGAGWLIVKTGSLWGAVLIHAAADLFLFIAMLAKA